MKQVAKMLLITIVIALGLTSARAEKPKTPEQRQQIVEKQVTKLTRKLKLTPDQQTQVRTILQDKMDRQQQAEDEANVRLRAVLTPDQAAKHNDFMD